MRHPPPKKRKAPGKAPSNTTRQARAIIRPPETAATAVYRPRTIKRDRRTRERVELLDNQILEVLQEDHPQSIRHVFYRMTDPRLAEPVSKSEQGYRAVQHRITELRRSGRLPYGWITDSTRRGYHTPTFKSGADFLRAYSGLYRADIWRDAPYYVEVWCESRSIAGVIESDCRELAVSLYPAGGFSSITLAYQAAENIAEETNHGEKPCVIVYIGDYDPAGVLIDVSIERELRAHLDPDINLDFQRLAITEEQIAEFGLPTKPRKLTDRRATHIRETVEAEAMPASTLRSLLRLRIESYMPAGALAIAKVAERSEREHLERMAQLMAAGR